jgi:Protein of unknown function (DUF3574)
MHITSRIAVAAVTLGSLAVPVGIAVAADSSPTQPLSASSCDGLVGDDFVRTELFFGLSRPHGRITERQFDRFVDEVVTPRFPDGLTVLAGDGQFRLADGDIIEERSKLLILLHPGDDVDSKEIEEIRVAYIDEFEQQSVLRTDERTCISF